MSKVINVGPFLLQYPILIAILSLIVSYYVFKVKLKNMNSRMSPDIYMNSMLIWGVFWRFGSILWNFDIFIQNPFSVLYLAGSEKTMWIGFILACLYLFIKCRKKVVLTWELLDILFVPVLTFLAIYHLLLFQYGYETKVWWGLHISSTSFKYHPVNFYYLILDLSLLIWLWIRTKSGFGYGLIFAKSLVVYGIVAFIITFTMPQRIFLIGLSQTQLVYSTMVLMGIIIYTIRSKVNQNNE